MEMVTLDGCCGIGVIYALEEEPCDCGDEECRTEYFFDEEQFDGCVKASYNENHGYMICTINDAQEVRGLGTKLVNKGFARVRRFHNPNSRNMVSIYMKRHANLHRNDATDAEDEDI